MELSEVKLSSSTVHIEQSEVGSSFEGTLEGDVINGKFQMLGVEGPLHLERREAKPVPYRTEEVRFSNGDITLAGTLFLPSTAGPHPAVVLAPSSGPTTRKDFSFLADHLARQGIAALAYDKRGVGESAPEFDWGRASLLQMAGDALAGLKTLQARTDIARDKVGLFGQSNSAWVVEVAASRSRLPAFLVMVSGGGVTGPQAELYRVEQRMREEGFAQAEIGRALAFMKLKFEVGRTGRGWERLHALAGRDKNEKWFHQVNAPDSLARLREAWRGEFSYNPALLLKTVRCPVLAIAGAADTFVPPEPSTANIERVLKAARHPDYTIKILPKAEHGILIFPGAGEPWHWPSLAPGYLDTLTGWIHAKTGK
jgi:pimeloyl-ACP methyl ester carboxylesterase